MWGNFPGQRWYQWLARTVIYQLHDTPCFWARFRIHAGAEPTSITGGRGDEATVVPEGKGEGGRQKARRPITQKRLQATHQRAAHAAEGGTPWSRCVGREEAGAQALDHA